LGFCTSVGQVPIACGPDGARAGSAGRLTTVDGELQAGEDDLGLLSGATNRLSVSPSLSGDPIG